MVDSQEPESVLNGKDLLFLNVLILDRTGAIDAEVMLFFILVIFERQDTRLGNLSASALVKAM